MMAGTITFGRCATFAATVVCASALMGAAPAHQDQYFPSATVTTLPNGVVVLTQASNDAPIASAQVFIPSGLAQQTADKAGIAAVTAATVLRTPVAGGASLADAASAAGGDAVYTVDPDATRFQIECRTDALPGLLRALAHALAAPDAAQVAAARDEVSSAARDAEKNPVLAAYAMVRQVRYQGNGFAYPQGGRAVTLARLTAQDVQNFAASYQHGKGTVIALTGALSPETLDAARDAFSGMPASAAPAAPVPTVDKRQHEIVAHRDIAAPWLAIGYGAPSQYSNDFPAMLVIQALLGRGGDIHALSFGSAGFPDAGNYVGAFYQYEASPGSFVIFLNGGTGSVDAALRQIEMGIARLRSEPLPAELVTRAKQLALGDYYLSVTSLSDAAWLLGRSAGSPDGVAFENGLAARIGAVSVADVERVAKQYLTDETVAVVLPTSAGR